MKQLLVTIGGMEEAAPSLGPDGQPNGQGMNAGFLQLVAQLAPAGGRVAGRRFTVAPIPILVTATTASPVHALAVDTRWFWGVQYSMWFTSDGGRLIGIDVKEKIDGGLRAFGRNEKSGLFSAISVIFSERS